LIHIDDVLARLDGVTGSNGQWQARCPCRLDDNSPSLAVGIRDEHIVFHCFRGTGGCSADKICETLGIKMNDLFPDDLSRQVSTQPVNTPAVAVKKEQKLTKVATYEYQDALGELLFEKIRYVDQDGRKTFRQRRPDGSGGWEYSLGDTPKVLYNLPAVAAAGAAGSSIFVVEGEKDAETLISMGIVATTMPGGAGPGKWLDIHTETLTGSGTIDIIADNDDAGKQHALNVFTHLTEAGCDVAVWICPKNKDISDHLAAGGKMEELVPLALDFTLHVDTDEVPMEQGVVETEDAFTRALTRLGEVFSREDLTSQQKIAKMSMITNSATAEEPLDAGRLVVWEDFVKEAENDDYDWVIPGLLERGERVIVVAAEGVGKTMLMRQIAITAGAGIHPFTYQPIRPVVTLTVDLENPETIIRRMSKKMISDGARTGKQPHNLARLYAKPGGLDLLKAADRALLEKQIEIVQPELICMGPLYKAYIDPGGRTSDAIAVEIARYLDSLRVMYKCAMWFEHHAPLGTTMATRDLRPFGSSVWSRWPEFGISMSPVPTGAPFTYEVRHFRGARDQRKWPTLLRRADKSERFAFTVLEYLEYD
jgi:hypothetical protein